MLFIDPQTCIDCGACVEECPAEAIIPDDELSGRAEEYLRINADYFRDHDVDGGVVVHRVIPPLPDGELHVAIVGAGPAAFYAAGELLDHPQVSVDMFDRLPTPYGLVRAGVAPDHAATKGVETVFGAIAAKRNFTYFLNVEVGTHITHDELVDRYHAVIYAVGAAADKRLDIDGEELRGSMSATEFVAWYNGHPDHVDVDVDLSAPRAVVVGNGNVALDVARILTSDPDDLATTDIADHALTVLRASQVREVVILARRGVAQASYTNSEFLALGDLRGVDVVIDPADLVLDPVTATALEAGTLDSTIAPKIRLAAEFAERPLTEGNRRIVFRFLTTPLAMVGAERVEAVRTVGNSFAEVADSAEIVPSGPSAEIDAGLVLRAVGYRGKRVPNLPFDDSRGVVPHRNGRVHPVDDGGAHGLYVAGWIKRGAHGGIGMNRRCGEETARTILDDHSDGLLGMPSRSRDDVADIIASRGGRQIDYDGWCAIDSAERAAGRPTGRRRVKLVTVRDLEAAAGALIDP